ncbi:doublesex- and mab-3-related transcription factor C2-like isoform X2 [Vicugna pacos]|nr:doublesex- and mab-3-related transcription factor C1 [Vicugna pacos]
MDPNEMPAVSCCPPNPITGLETRAPWGIGFRSIRAIRRCVRYWKHGITDQVKDPGHLCLFQACKRRKCSRFSEHCSILPAEHALKRELAPHQRGPLTRSQLRRLSTLPKAQSHVEKEAIQEGVISKLPRSSADRSSHGIFVSVLDSSTLDEATNNFSFEEFPQAPCLAQQAPKACDQASVSASLEWQRKLEAAEALLALRESCQAPSSSISLLQPCTVPAPAGDRGLQPPPPNPLQPKPASSVSVPIGHLGCIPLSN